MPRQCWGMSRQCFATDDDLSCELGWVQDTLSADDLMGQLAFPVVELKQGVHELPLLSHRGITDPKVPPPCDSCGNQTTENYQLRITCMRLASRADRVLSEQTYGNPTVTIEISLGAATAERAAAVHTG